MSMSIKNARELEPLKALAAMRGDKGTEEETNADGFASGLTRFVLELDHAFEPIHGRGAIEEPGEFGMCRDVGLDEYL